MAERSVALRLGVVGGTQVKAELQGIGTAGKSAFDNIGTAGEAAARKAQQAFDRAATDVEAAMARQARAADRISQFTPQTPIQQRINSSVSSGGPGAGSARESAEAFRELLMATDRSSTALVRHTDVSGRARAASQQLSYQISDVATSFAGGINPMVIFAQQGSQVIQALTLMKGEATGLLGFLGGPWGAVIMGAVSIVGVLGSKLLDTADADKKAAEEAKKHADAIDQLVRAQRSEIQTQGDVVRQKAISIEIARREREETVKQTIALLEQAKAREDAANAQAVGGRALNYGAEGPAQAASAERQRLEKALADARAALVESTDAAKIALARNVALRVDANSTPEGKVAYQYDQRRAALLGSGVDATQIARGLTALNAQRDRELKAIEESTRKVRDHSRAVADADTLTAASVAKMLRSAIPGVDITSTTRSAEHNAAVGGAKGSYHVRGNAVDFVPPGGMGSMTKDDVRRIFSARGIDIIELLGPGDKGHSDHFHVAWVKGKQSLDNFSDAAKRATDAQNALDQAMSSIQQAFDPAASAAKEYADELARIALLESRGVIGAGEATSYARAARFKMVDAQQQAQDAANAAMLKDAGLPADDVQLFKPEQFAKQDEDLRQMLGVVKETQSQFAGLQDIGVNAIDAITDPANWRNLGDVAKSIIMDIERELIRVAVSNPLKQLLFGGGDSGGGGGGFLGKILGLGTSLLGGGGGGLGGGGGGDIILGGGLKVPAFATGTDFAPGGLALLHANELVELPRGSRVNSAAATRAMFNSNDNQRGPAIGSIHIDATGADAAGLARVEAALDRLRRDVPGIAASTVADARQRRVI